MRRKMLAVVVAMIAATAVASQAEAATLYVSTSGSDASNGSITTPYRTITKAAQVAKPGDQVHVRGGVYYETVTIVSKGTASARILFRSYPGETAIIDGSQALADKNGVTFYQASYVDFSDFEVRNAKRVGICGWGANNIRVLNNLVHSAWRNGIYFGYDTMGAVYDITVDGNTVRNNVLENQNHTWSGGWANGVVVAKADRARITNNKVYNNDGEGAGFLLTTNGVLEGNEIYDNFSVGIYIDNSRQITVNRNFVYSTGNVRYYRDGHPAAGIGTANEFYESALPLSDLTFTNNIVVNARWGFYYGAYDAGGGLRNVTVTNNTFYKATQAMLWIETDAHANSVFQNNLFYQSGTGRGADVAGTGVTYRNNGWYGVGAGAAAGIGDLLNDPKFIRAGGARPEDYKLTALSPAVHRGIDLSPVATDYFGATRTASYDLGAHELSLPLGSSAPVGSPLVAPSGFTASARTESTVELSWNNSGAALYNVYRNGAKVATVSTTRFNDSGLTSATRYTYAVASADADGLESERVSTEVRTRSESDTAAPATPGTPVVGTVTNASVALSWSEAADNVRVAAYRVYRDGVMVSSLGQSTFTDRGVTGGTTYRYEISAIDNAGNESPRTTAVTVTTPAAKSKRRAS